MKRTAITIFMLLVLLVPVFAASYEKGSSLFVFKAGASEPFMYHFPYLDEKFAFWNDGTHLDPGFSAGVSYQVFLGGHFAAGAQLSYMINTDINDRSKSLIEVPISALFSVMAVHAKGFDLSMSLYAGANYIRYEEDRYLAPYSMLALSPVFYLAESWGIGIEAGITATFEVYGNGNPRHVYSAVSSLLPITLCVTYRE